MPILGTKRLSFLPLLLSLCTRFGTHFLLFLIALICMIFMFKNCAQTANRLLLPSRIPKEKYHAGVLCNAGSKVYSLDGRAW